jgi:glutamine synthetase
LNTIVAEELSQIADRLEKATDFNKEVQALLKEIVTKHSRIIFNGNNYSDEWVTEAETRGLPNIRSTVEAAKAFIDEKNIKVFEKHGVFTRAELESRFEIMLETYVKVVNIEAQTMLDMAKRDIVPAVVNYASDLADSINTIKATGVAADTSVQAELLTRVSSLLAAFSKAVVTLEGSLAKADSLHGSSYDHAYFFRYDVFMKMGELRKIADEMETITGADYWPVPVYGDLLFRV